MARKKRKSLIFTIMRMSVIPIAILGVVMTFYSQNSVHEGMVFEIEKSLSGIAHNLISIYNVLDSSLVKCSPAVGAAAEPSCLA